MNIAINIQIVYLYDRFVDRKFIEIEKSVSQLCEGDRKSPALTTLDERYLIYRDA
jgi:hypothetical protein